jgi:hypothetical protein
MGARGDLDSKAVAAAHSHLMTWLEDHAGKFEASGELRVLGYNSPMIPIDKRYFEVQVPVRERRNAE